MKITKIKRLVSFGEHENIELEAELSDGDTVDQVHKNLLVEIYKQIGKLRDMDYVTRSIDELQQTLDSRLNRIKQLGVDIMDLEQKKAGIEEWLKKFDISPNAFDNSEIPF